MNACLEKNERSCYFERMNVAATPAKGPATRELILDHAYELARLSGLEGLSIGTLATGVGMSKSGVFAHFGSREDLQLAVLDTAARRFMARVLVPALSAPRGLPRLRALVAQWCAWGQEHQSGCVLLTAAGEYDGREGVLHDAVVAQQAGWRGELEKAIGQAVAQGHLRDDTDAAQLGFEIYALMLGLHHDAGLFGFEQASRRTNTAFERLWRSWQP